MCEGESMCVRGRMCVCEGESECVCEGERVCVRGRVCV